VTNPWFPLRPGSVYRYRGVKDGKPSRDVMTVTRRIRTIEGAKCIAVSDLLYLNGKLGERTTDYYTQDPHGNVWYFGERTAELDANGHVTSTSGSWLTGVHGARPGIFMFARPRPGLSARQEYLKGEAEDMAEVLSITAAVTVATGSYTGMVQTKETTPLEPDALENKYYARGIGPVLTVDVAGGGVRDELVSFTP